METVVFFLALSTLPRLSEPLVNLVAPYNPVVEILSGDFRIFSGEGVELRCTVPDHMSTWQYRWFKGSEELHYHGQIFVLWKARVDDTGKYSCQGVRDTVVGDIRTLQSVPVEIIVDGGWALTHVTPQPALVGHSLEVTCRVRGRRPLSEVILYRDGVEVMRNQGNNPKFLLSNLTIEDQGMYSCRASWDTNSQTHSVISVHIPGMVRRGSVQTASGDQCQQLTESQDEARLPTRVKTSRSCPSAAILFLKVKKGAG
ncbi:unnamed protein product [Tetraodon nigroviridis]|uniref:(spotted green pufferfish) hypothetical protein n=1 Tax=Tetraodon nigroviridis TaxID=99883 RepID=Q4SPM6_TETNG|nr:unnamed protein product [Tetraodon nigroviridis]